MSNSFEIRNERWAYLQNMLDSYFADISNDDPLWERMEAVKADNDASYVAAVRADIAELLRQYNDDLTEIYDRELRSHYWPGGDGLTPREWLTQVSDLLATPPDTSRDHRTGLFG